MLFRSPGCAASQVGAHDVERAIVEAHRRRIDAAGEDLAPLQVVGLGCGMLQAQLRRAIEGVAFPLPCQ